MGIWNSVRCSRTPFARDGRVDVTRRAHRAEAGTPISPPRGKQAAAEQEEILRRGYSKEHRCFTQALDGKFPDASNLLLPTLGLLDARDPRFLTTLDTYAERLVLDGLMLRYRNDDDFGTPTSAFSICTFWWATALAQAGRLEEAITVFERIAGFANPVGLFSEDIDPGTGDLLGNFPQAYTHVGLIQAATTIGSLLEAERGHLSPGADPAPPHRYHRLPVTLARTAEGLTERASAGGVAVGLRGLHVARGGLWVGWSGITQEELGADLAGANALLARHGLTPCLTSVKSARSTGRVERRPLAALPFPDGSDPGRSRGLGGVRGSERAFAEVAAALAAGRLVWITIIN
jgi:hypothetical protein